MNNKVNFIKEGIDTYEVIEMLNKFEEKFLFNEKDMYHSGEWLYADVDYNNKVVKEEIDLILSNIEGYRVANNEWFTHSKDQNIIGLSYLVAYCEETFKQYIKYYTNDDDDETYFYVE